MADTREVFPACPWPTTARFRRFALSYTFTGLSFSIAAVGGDLFCLRFPDEGTADRRLLGDASTPRVGLGWRDQQVGRFFAIGVANLDFGAETNDAVARRTIFDRLGGGQ